MVGLNLLVLRREVKMERNLDRTFIAWLVHLLSCPWWAGAGGVGIQKSPRRWLNENRCRQNLAAFTDDQITEKVRKRLGGVS